MKIDHVLEKLKVPKEQTRKLLWILFLLLAVIPWALYPLHKPPYILWHVWPVYASALAIGFVSTLAAYLLILNIPNWRKISLIFFIYLIAYGPIFIALSQIMALD